MWILAASIVAIGLFTSSFLLLRGFNRIITRLQDQVYADIEARVVAWVEPGPEGKASKLGEILQASGAIVGNAAAKSLVGQIGAMNGAAAKQANIISDAIEGQNNPMAGLLQGIRGIKKGKGASIERLASLIGPMLANNHGSNGGSGVNLTRLER